MLFLIIIYPFFARVSCGQFKEIAAIIQGFVMVRGTNVVGLLLLKLC